MSLWHCSEHGITGPVPWNICPQCGRGLSRAEVVPLDCTDLIAREGWDCPDCGHRHGGRTIANICIGCPCERTQRPTAPDLASSPDQEPRP